MDWWSFGILIYELLYGFTPFRGKKRDETFNNILKRTLTFPEQPEVSDACKVRKRRNSNSGTQEVQVETQFQEYKFRCANAPHLKACGGQMTGQYVPQGLAGALA